VPVVQSTEDSVTGCRSVGFFVALIFRAASAYQGSASKRILRRFGLVSVSIVAVAFAAWCRARLRVGIILSHHAGVLVVTGL
jgi:hypothetical protein